MEGVATGCDSSLWPIAGGGKSSGDLDAEELRAGGGGGGRLRVLFRGSGGASTSSSSS